MWSFLSLLKTKSSLLIFALFVVLLSSCGTATNGTNNTKQAQEETTSDVTASPQKKTSLVDLLAPNKDNMAVNIGGLHIQEDGGFHCPGSSYGAAVNLVFASDRLTYDQGEIQQMAHYIPSIDPNSTKTPSSPPASLRFVEGTGTSQHPGKNVGACFVAFQITNTSDTTIQIPHLALRVKKKPVPNTFTYRLINECSVVSYVCNGGRGGFPGYCGSYAVSLSLGVTQANAEIGGKPDAGVDANRNPCPVITLAPRQATTLDVSVSGLAFVYTVFPEFTTTTAQGQKLLKLPALTSNLAFSDQFSCYKLQGNRFVVDDGRSMRCV